MAASSAIPEKPWRVAIVTRILPVLLGLCEATRACGHEPVALLTVRDTSGRYGGFDIGASLHEAPAELEVLMPARRSSLAPLLRSVQPDLVLCMGFPWKVPQEALDVPPLGWLNGHPSLLPRHRGPTPVAWAILAGEREIGLTVHRMAAELDAGAIMAQRTFPFGDDFEEPDDFYPRTGPPLMELFAEAMAKLAAGDAGVEQRGGDYESFLGEDVARLDRAGTADEAHRRVWAWRYSTPQPVHGALVELDGETVRVLASSLREVDGARRLDFADGPLWIVRTERAD